MTTEYRQEPGFSFEYGQQASREFLAGWEVSETREAAEGGEVRRVVYREPGGALEVTVHLRSFDGYTALERMVEFANVGAADTGALAEVLPLDIDLPRPEAERITLHHAQGSLCELDDFQPRTTALPVGGELGLAPQGGRSSNGVLPCMNLQCAGGGLVVAIGWSGQWAARFGRDKERVRITAGQERTHLVLRPGERIRTPRVLLIAWEGEDAFLGNNLLRRMLLAHYTPRVDGELAVPPVAHMTMSTYHRTRMTNEANELDALEHAHALGVEAYWIDACWYGDHNNWVTDVGNWRINPDRFPHGLAPIGAAAREHGMDFVLWFEPERVHESAPVTREHPEFLVRLGGNPNLLFNLGDPAARRYMTDLISGIISASGVTIYRQDHNFDPLAYWQSLDAPDRVGLAEIRYIEGLYAMWDELRDRHPGLRIDNCASGGRRIDLETTARSYPLWRSDFSDVGGPSHGPWLQIGDQMQTAGLSRWVPLHAAAVWTFSPYAFWSAMAAGVVIYCDVRGEDFPAERARQAVAQLKSLRPYYLGDFYPLVPLHAVAHDWCAYQYHRPDMQEGFALFLRRHESPFPTMVAGLREIDEEAKYEVSLADDFGEPAPTLLSGRDLQKLAVSIGEAPGARLLRYRCA